MTATTTAPDPTTHADAAELLERLREFNVGMLVTRAANGDLRARPMNIAELEDDGTLWMITNEEAAKVDEIARQPEVNLTFQEGRLYLSVSGRAESLDDRQRIHDLWSPEWKVWFPDGPDDPEIRLLRIEPRRGEYWDVAGLNQVSYAFHALKAVIRGEEIEHEKAGEHGKAEL